MDQPLFLVSKNRVPLVGLEPTRQATPVPKTGTSTIPSQRLSNFILLKKIEDVNY